MGFILTLVLDLAARGANAQCVLWFTSYYMNDVCHTSKRNGHWSNCGFRMTVLVHVISKYLLMFYKSYFLATYIYLPIAYIQKRSEFSHDNLLKLALSALESQLL